MAEDNEQRVALLMAGGGVTDRQVQDALQTIWATLKNDSDVRRFAEEEKLSPELFGNDETIPFRVGQAEGQILETGAILVIIGKAALAWGTKKSRDVLWDRFIWPRLQKKLPDVEETDRYGR
jgi:hypothetical protein